MDGFVYVPPEKAWFIITVWAGRDYRVRDELISRAELPAADVWVAECKIRKMLRGVVLTHTGPIFPGYVFVRIGLDDSVWHRVRKARWVDGFLERNGRPCPLPNGDVARLEAIARDRALVIEVGGAIRREFAVGDSVKVLNGPFTGWEGVVSERVNDRLRVLLDIFGRATPTLVPETSAVMA